MAELNNQPIPVDGKETGSNLTNQLTGLQATFTLLLEEFKSSNKINTGLTLGQIKYEREIAVPDGDKREEQLDEVIAGLKEVRLAVTGIKFDTNIEPLVNIGENQTILLQELNKESSLTRKLTEGSVEYDKEAAQYRNTSGKDIESVVSGKTSKAGGFIDFETARDTLSGQGKRVREENAFSLKPINYIPGKATANAVPRNVTTRTRGVSSGDNIEGNTYSSKGDDLESPKYQGFFEELKNGLKFLATDGLSEKTGYGVFQKPPTEVVKKEREAKIASPRQVNPEADNVTTTDEIQADAAKSDLELSKQMLDTTREQLTELKAIREALAPSTPKELVEQKSAPSSTNEKENNGSLIGDLAGAAGNLLGGKGSPSKSGKGIGGKMLGGIGKAARVLGPVAAVAGAAYSGVEGYQNTNVNFDIPEGQEATIGQKTASTLGGVASGLTFGLLDEKTAAQGIHKAGEVISDTASKAGSYIGEKASSIGSSISNFFGVGNKDTSKTISTQAATNTSSSVNNTSNANIINGTQSPVQGVSAEAATLARSNYASVDPRRVDSAGRDVAQTSIENVDMAREASGRGGSNNTVVSNNVSSNNTTKIVPMKANPRPEYTGSSLDRYTNRITVY